MLRYIDRSLIGRLIRRVMNDDQHDKKVAVKFKISAKMKFKIEFPEIPPKFS